MRHTVTISLPESIDSVGRWMESHGACLTLSSMLGMYTATIESKHVVTYDDKNGAVAIRSAK